MLLKFVGTSSGQTHPKRFHSSFIIFKEEENLLIDCGDGTSKALLQQNVDPNKINNIVFTHYHSDHLAGLPSLLTQMIIDKRKSPLKIFTHKNLIKLLQNFLHACFLFIDKFDFKAEIVGFEFEEKMNIFNNFSFMARRNNHIRNKHNIRIEDVEFISSSFLFTTNKSKIIYTSDIGNKEDLYLFQDIHADVFITETTHVPLLKIEEAATILNPVKTYLTHINDELKIREWHSKLPTEKLEKIIIAEDGMCVKL